jgi:hypothetical protein
VKAEVAGGVIAGAAAYFVNPQAFCSPHGYARTDGIAV